MDVPTSQNRFCLSDWSARRKSRYVYLTSVSLALPSLWSAARLSARHHVFWEIQNTRAVIGRCALSISTLSVANAASPSVSGHTVQGLIGQHRLCRWQAPFRFAPSPRISTRNIRWSVCIRTSLAPALDYDCLLVSRM